MLRKVKRKNAGNDDMVEPTQYDEMSPVFRLVSLYELALHEEWRYVKLFCPLDRPMLRNGIFIGVGIEAFRAVVVLSILMTLVVHRIQWMNPLEGPSTAFSIGSKLLIYWTFISLILFFLIIFQAACYYTQSAGKIVVSTCLNIVFSLLLICLFFILALYTRNSENIMKDTFLRNLQPFSKFQYIQKQYKCCGFESIFDYKNSELFTFQDPMTYEEVRVENTLVWTHEYDNFMLNVPETCCRKMVKSDSIDRSCAFQNGTDLIRLREMFKSKDYATLRTLIEIPSIFYVHPTGCITMFTKIYDKYVFFLNLLLIVFLILTAAMILFVIVLLLYEDGIGQVVSKSTLYDVSRNTGVNWLMNLDNFTDKPFIDEFSLIEYLRETDIDKIVVEAPPIETKKRLL